MSDRRRCLIVGRGRAGGSFEIALARVGWSTSSVSGHLVVQGDTSALRTVDDHDLVLVAVPDDAVAAAADSIPPCEAVVAHVSGSLGLDVFHGHARMGSIHPLMSLPDADTGAARLLDGCTFAVDGDPMMKSVVIDLGGTGVVVPDERRALYHTVAAIASNHVTALCAQIERLAAEVGVPVEAYWKLMRTTLDNVESVGAVGALTGPAARGDWQTIERHLDALPDDDRALYVALCGQAAALAGRVLPGHLLDQHNTKPS